MALLHGKVVVIMLAISWCSLVMNGVVDYTSFVCAHCMAFYPCSWVARFAICFCNLIHFRVSAPPILFGAIHHHCSGT